MSKLRLFFAIWPDAQTQAACVTLQRSLHGLGRPVAGDNLHLTLHFLGAVDDQRLAALLALGDQVVVDHFQLVFTRLGYWKKPQVVWLGVDEVPQPLTDLVGQLRVALLDQGFQLEDRHYRPHLTLMRKVRQYSSRGDISALRCDISHFSLVSSTMSAGGVRYRVLQSWPLADKS